MDPKEEQEKQAALVKEAEEVADAFEFGMDVFFKDHGIEKDALADIVQVPEDALPEVAAACLEEQQKTAEMQENASQTS